MAKLLFFDWLAMQYKALKHVDFIKNHARFYFMSL